MTRRSKYTAGSPNAVPASDRAARTADKRAKAVAALSHPNILSIHDVGVEQGVAYAVMELLTGQTLRERLRDLGIEFQEATVPASPIHQIFVRDPAGILVELTYDKHAESLATA